MSEPQENWTRVFKRLLQSDPVALMKLTRLSALFLTRLRAYDFADDWDDLIQESILATAFAVQDMRVERGKEAVYLRTTLRNQFNGRLRRHFDKGEKDAIPWRLRATYV